MVGCMAMTNELSPLPDPADAESLGALDESSLQAARADLQQLERETVNAMRPYETRLREIRTRLGEIATEERQRQRQTQIASRAQVRAEAKSGAAPTIAQLLESGADISADTQLEKLPAFLATGGEVGLGFATKPGFLNFTDGRQNRSVATWGDAHDLFNAGWELGTPGLPGVRIHIKGSRTERLVSADEVVIRLDQA